MKNPIPKLIAIHDLSAFGRASLGVALPILSSLGIQTSPLATSFFSTHGGFKGYKSVDLNESLIPFIDHWVELGIEFDAVYSGFLATEEQIDIVKHIYDKFSKSIKLKVVDPVLGDNGKLYSHFTNKNMVGKMFELVACADVITPNITEVGFLLGLSNDEIKDLPLEKLAMLLSCLGPSKIVITGIEDRESMIHSTIAYDKKIGKFEKFDHELIPANYPGCGDTFTSILTGKLLNDQDFFESVKIATKFIKEAVKYTYEQEGYDNNEGLIFEKMMPLLFK